MAWWSRRRRNPFVVGAAAAASVAFIVSGCVTGCGKDQKRSPSDSATGSGSGTGTASGVTVSTGGLKIRPFEYGPYLAADLAGSPDSEVAVEFGMINMRTQHYSGAGDTFDYRWKQASATAAKILPTTASAGCSEFSSLSTTTTATSVDLSGAWTDSLSTATNGVFRAEDRAEAKKIDAAGTLTAAVKSGGTTLASVETPTMPTVGAIKFFGAFDLNLTTNLEIADFNQNLTDATGDLNISDIAKATNYNLLIVTFVGGSAAKTKVLRCFIKPAGKVAIPPAVYKKLLPIKGVIGWFANVEVKSDGGLTTWAAAFQGTGVEDEAVP